MSGSAKFCDKDLLTVGSPCIIEVNDVNSPTGLWWGEVIDVKNHNDWLEIIAKITGGEFKVYSNVRTIPVKSDQYKDVIPHVNYTVYPCTETIIWLFERIKNLEKLRENANNKIFIIKDFLKDILSKK